MAFRIGSAAARLIAAAACLGLVLGTAACASDDAAGTDGSDKATSEQTDSTGLVAIFTPADGVTLSQSTPLNKWTKFVPSLVKALRAEGMAKSGIDTSTADSLDRQSRDIQDYVVDHVSADSGKKDDGVSSITLVVAPVTDPDKAISQYGDYVSQSVVGSASVDDADKADMTDDELDELEAADRLVSSLKLAQESGMHVVMLSGMADGFRPDAYVQMSTARLIGTLQAQKMADKLELGSASTDNPKSIEVLLPYDAGSDADDASSAAGTADEKGSDTKDPSDGSDAQTVTIPAGSSQFVQEMFAGIWSVLQPYFAQGKAISPSGTLSASTTAEDWESVAYADDGDDATRNELRRRLGMDGSGDSHTRIDGIIAMNDYTASDVIKELGSLGYTGSSADINPSITISGIVENITGKKDLQRGSVPDPIKAPEADDGGSDSDTDAEGAVTDEDIEKINRRWPIVTGYGAYVDSIPQIVNGQQWMTALEDREALAEDTAQACLLLNAGKTLKGSFVKTVKIDGESMPMISEELLSVSASNLKTTLIDPGYITLAEAGL